MFGECEIAELFHPPDYYNVLLIGSLTEITLSIAHHLLSMGIQVIPGQKLCPRVELNT